MNETMAVDGTSGREAARAASPGLEGRPVARALTALAGLGMIVASVMTIRHFFLANYPSSIYSGAFCDISAFFNCDSSAFSPIAQVLGIPLGYPGIVMGALVVLAAVFPSAAFQRTNKFLLLLNVLGVAGLFGYSVFVLGKLCLLCSGYYLFSILAFLGYAAWAVDRRAPGILSRWGRPSLVHLAVFAVLGLGGAAGMLLYHGAKKEAQVGASMKVVQQYYALPKVPWPSTISPYRLVSSTPDFEGAPIRIVVYADLLCPDCQYLARQLKDLEKEFAGKMNVAFQFFPLEAKCNTVVEKDIHPGACEIAWISAQDPSKFTAIHDEVFANTRGARDEVWRRSLAQRYGVEAAYDDPATHDIVKKIIDTGAEYEKTSDKYSHGIRSTPTIILNNRMIIGTLPSHHLRALFQALVEESEGGGRKFLENWVPLKPARKAK